MGHYLVVSGYDDGVQMLTVQDSLTNPDLPMSYADLAGSYWRDFNYVYVLVYPAEREAELLALLGPRADETASYKLAEQRALQETQTLSGRELFFAWFNLGSSRVGLKDYAGAAQAYDQAFALYQNLSEDLRPYRLMWYQAGPYAAYYQAGRYQDVVSLATPPLAGSASRCWRARGSACRWRCAPRRQPRTRRNSRSRGCSRVFSTSRTRPPWSRL
jgi:tetratricopeptide (TPR) repeat protein